MYEPLVQRQLRRGETKLFLVVPWCGRRAGVWQISSPISRMAWRRHSWFLCFFETMDGFAGFWLWKKKVRGYHRPLRRWCTADSVPTHTSAPIVVSEFPSTVAAEVRWTWAPFRVAYSRVKPSRFDVPATEAPSRKTTTLVIGPKCNC